MPMQPRPRADTSRLLFPSLRFCILSPSTGRPRSCGGRLRREWRRADEMEVDDGLRSRSSEHAGGRRAAVLEAARAGAVAALAILIQVAATATVVQPVPT